MCCPCASRWRRPTSPSFEQAAADIDRVEQFLYPQLRLIVSSLLPDYRSELLEVPAWPEGLTPSIAPLGDKVTMDLGVSWWGSWFAARRAAKERANHLRCLIEEDFLKIADELVQEAETQLDQRVDYIMGRVNAISNGLRAGIERRTENLAREQALLDGAGDEESLERFEAEQRQRADACAGRLEAYAAAPGRAYEGARGAGRLAGRKQARNERDRRPYAPCDEKPPARELRRAGQRRAPCRRSASGRCASS